ncbi:MAG: uroporphyrinogen decarboxylase family protein, partial [Chloroflexota bacterium]
GAVRFDWWGAGFDTAEEGYFPCVRPLQENRDLDRFPWPDPSDPGLLDEAVRAIQADRKQHFIVPNLGFALFERGWALRGFDTLLMDLSLDEAYAAELFDRIVEIQLQLIRRFLDAGVDGGYFGDDYGAQRNMLFSPVSWRKLIKPRLARLFAPFVERGLPVLMHSDGQIQKIIPDLVEIGLTALNPVQPEVLDHSWLRSSFGGVLAFYGGVSTQTVLPQGTPDQVREAVRACRAQLAPDHTGLILAPSHRMMADIPVENVTALLEAFQED